MGLFVTPLALAVIYFVIPAATRRPIYSHFLSMLGFWLLFFLYPLNGTHHYVFSVIPMSAQIGAITASALLGVDVVIVVTIYCCRCADQASSRATWRCASPS